MPIPGARRAKAWAAAHLDMWKLGRQGRRHFRGDARYDLRNVTEGFRSRIDEQADDARLIERICTAYAKAKQREANAPPAVCDTASWRRLREGSLRPFSRALQAGNVSALQTMLRNFYRDPCSSGLLAPPHGMAKAYFRGRIRDIYRHFYLSHVLYRFDYWKTVTNNQFTEKELAGPGAGNPFGVVIDGTHIAVGAEYAHYCAQRVLGLLAQSSSERPVAMEIGGGFGAIAYFLLRNGRPATYVNCDMPERLALSAYYLFRSFPERHFVLYGESELSPATISRTDAVFVPAFDLDALAAQAADVAFSSVAMQEHSLEGLRDLLRQMGRIVRHSLLFIENQRTSEALAQIIGQDHPAFTLADRRLSDWHTRGISGAGRPDISGAAGSSLVEQNFSHNLAG
jgi:hypothetical protein